MVTPRTFRDRTPRGNEVLPGFWRLIVGEAGSRSGAQGWGVGGWPGGAGGAPGVGDVEGAVGFERGVPARPVDDVVVPAAQADEVAEGGLAAVFPRHDMVRFGPVAGPVATRRAATLVA